MTTRGGGGSATCARKLAASLGVGFGADSSTFTFSAFASASPSVLAGAGRAVADSGPAGGLGSGSCDADCSVAADHLDSIKYAPAISPATTDRASATIGTAHDCHAPFGQTASMPGCGVARLRRAGTSVVSSGASSCSTRAG